MQGTRKLISLKLSQNDEDHLMLYKDFVGSTHAVCRHEDNGAKKISLSFASDDIYDMLESRGICGLKPSRNPDELLANSRHFWRGVLDADGCIMVKNRRPVLICYAWHPLIDKFYAFCEKHNCLYKSIIRDSVSISRYTLSGARAAKMCSILYTDCDHHLPRKRELALHAMGYAN